MILFSSSPDASSSAWTKGKRFLNVSVIDVDAIWPYTQAVVVVFVVDAPVDLKLAAEEVVNEGRGPKKHGDVNTRKRNITRGPAPALMIALCSEFAMQAPRSLSVSLDIPLAKHQQWTTLSHPTSPCTTASPLRQGSFFSGPP
jgi:hypothetical protein